MLETLAAVPETQIAEEWREEWRKYRAFLEHHREHLRDDRDKLRKAGIDTSKMRPMGSAEAQMRIMAKRTKRGGYSCSVRGVRAMLKTIMKSKEGRPLTESERGHEPKLSVCKYYDPPVVARSETTVERVYQRDDPLVAGSDAEQSDREGIERIDKRKLKEKHES
ncbi:hypothetical protein GCM10010965_32400 [Caldalkalibacillus thermarum]|nr:hypothetical protein GCM10010965_32400 [Caldalkalibacillus thermarum]